MAVRHPSPLCSLRISQTARLGRGMPRPWASLKSSSFSQAAVKPIFSQNPMESRTERRWLKRAPPKAAPTMCPPRAKATHCEALACSVKTVNVMVCKGVCGPQPVSDLGVRCFQSLSSMYPFSTRAKMTMNLNFVRKIKAF